MTYRAFLALCMTLVVLSPVLLDLLLTLSEKRTAARTGTFDEMLFATSKGPGDPWAFAEASREEGRPSSCEEPSAP